MRANPSAPTRARGTRPRCRTRAAPGPHATARRAGGSCRRRSRRRGRCRRGAPAVPRGGTGTARSPVAARRARRRRPAGPRPPPPGSATRVGQVGLERLRAELGTEPGDQPVGLHVREPVDQLGHGGSLPDAMMGPMTPHGSGHRPAPHPRPTTTGAPHVALDPPIEPMLAKPIGGLPASAEGLAFEPKVDGFRALVFRRGDDVVIQGRMRGPEAAASGAWDLSYAFPEMVERIRQMRVEDVVLDGKVVVIRRWPAGLRRTADAAAPTQGGGRLEDHRAVRAVAHIVVAFDLLAADGADLSGAPAARRRAALVEVLDGEALALHHHAGPRSRRAMVRRPVRRRAHGLIARPLDGVYTPGKRTLFKVKPGAHGGCRLRRVRPYKGPGPDAQEAAGFAADRALRRCRRAADDRGDGRLPDGQRLALVERLRDLGGEDHPWAVPPQGRPGAAVGQGTDALVPTAAGASWRGLVQPGGVRPAAPCRSPGPLAPRQGPGRSARWRTSVVTPNPSPHSPACWPARRERIPPP